MLLLPLLPHSIDRLLTLYHSGIVLEKVAEYFYYNYKYRDEENVPEMHIPTELCLELLMAADYLDGMLYHTGFRGFVLMYDSLMYCHHVAVHAGRIYDMEFWVAGYQVLGPCWTELRNDTNVTLLFSSGDNQLRAVTAMPSKNFGYFSHQRASR